MSVGAINSPVVVALSGLSSRATNMEAVQFTPFCIPEEDVGYVTDDRKVLVFLWNGTNADITLTSVDGSGDITSITDDSSAPVIIDALTSLPVIITVGKYGPLEFNASFLFNSACSLTPSLTITGTRPLYSSDQPTPITLDDAISEIYIQPGDGVTFYDTLEFIELSSGASVKVVHSDEDLETPQGTFTACKFGCKHPETEGGIVGSLQITVDFLPLAAQRWIFEKCQTGTGITVYWRQYLGPNQEPDAYYPLPLDIVSVEQNWTGATITASFPMLTEMKFPRRIMTTAALPGGLT